MSSNESTVVENLSVRNRRAINRCLLLIIVFPRVQWFKEEYWKWHRVRASEPFNISMKNRRWTRIQERLVRRYPGDKCFRELVAREIELRRPWRFMRRADFNLPVVEPMKNRRRFGCITFALEQKRKFSIVTAYSQRKAFCLSRYLSMILLFIKARMRILHKWTEDNIL